MLVLKKIKGDKTFNTATGWGTMRANATGRENTATGYYALSNNTTGMRNVAAGVLLFMLIPQAVIMLE